MSLDAATNRFVGIGMTLFFLMVALWLVSPFLHVSTIDYSRGKEYGYRLALGLMILIVFVGKWAFDALSPQGLARKVSNVKAVALILMSLVIMGFIVFVVAQATEMYLRTAAKQQQQEQQQQQQQEQTIYQIP